MDTSIGPTDGPLVSLLVCTYNRRQYLPEALASAVNQAYRNLEIIVVNDGGEDVSDIVEGMGDPRIKFIDRRENRGYAFSVGQAADAATGKYIAYLGDDDFHYPDHIQRLVGALEGPTDCKVAYSNLYRTTVRIMPDGKRVTLGKNLDVRRDFDRFFILYINHVLGGSVMHHRDLLDKTGPYDPKITVFVDWYMTRLMAFFTDFIHVDHITGEYCVPEGKVSDRISYEGRKDTQKFWQNVVNIRTARPPKPWPKMHDVSVIYAPPAMGQSAAEALGKVANHALLPLQIYLALPADELSQLDMTPLRDLIVPVPVKPGTPHHAAVDAALARADGDLVTILPHEMTIDELWLVKAAYPLITSDLPDEAYITGQSPTGELGAVFRHDEFAKARAAQPNSTVAESIRAAGIELKPPPRDRLPMMLDDFYTMARDLQTAVGDARAAAHIYEKIPDRYANTLWMKENLARALHATGDDDLRALQLCRELNEAQPSVDTLLLEARLKRRGDRPDQAIPLLEQARKILQWQT